MKVDQPIELLQELQGRGFRNRVGPAGKPATTVFQRLLHDEALDESVVLCRPLTGRTHQIRLHLQWLKHPITNDPVYNDALYHSKRGWAAEATQSTLLELPTAVPPAPSPLSEQDKEEATGVAAERPPHFDRECPWCTTKWRDPEPSELVMYLHALAYDGPGWHYATPMPNWALGATLPPPPPRASAASVGDEQHSTKEDG